MPGVPGGKFAGRNPARRAAEIRAIVEVLKSAGFNLTVSATTGPGSARGLACAAVDAGAEAIIVCGGDGTHNEVANGLALGHCPVAILPGGTAYISDLGMCGDYNSVIGLEKEASIRRFVTRMPGSKKPEPAGGEATLCGVFVATDDATGLAGRIELVRVGGRLAPAMPTL